MTTGPGPLGTDISFDEITATAKKNLLIPLKRGSGQSSDVAETTLDSYVAALIAAKDAYKVFIQAYGSGIVGSDVLKLKIGANVIIDFSSLLVNNKTQIFEVTIQPKVNDSTEITGYYVGHTSAAFASGYIDSTDDLTQAHTFSLTGASGNAADTLDWAWNIFKQGGGE